jgi:hypothetical protein
MACFLWVDLLALRLLPIALSAPRSVPDAPHKLATYAASLELTFFGLSWHRDGGATRSRRGWISAVASLGERVRRRRGQYGEREQLEASKVPS